MPANPRRRMAYERGLAAGRRAVLFSVKLSLKYRGQYLLQNFSVGSFLASGIMPYANSLHVGPELLFSMHDVDQMK